MDRSSLRMDFQKLTIFGYRAREIARLLLLKRVLHQLLRGLCPGDGAEGQDQEGSGFPHTAVRELSLQHKK